MDDELSPGGAGQVVGELLWEVSTAFCGVSLLCCLCLLLVLLYAQQCFKDLFTAAIQNSLWPSWSQTAIDCLHVHTQVLSSWDAELQTAFLDYSTRTSHLSHSTQLLICLPSY